MKPSRYSSSRKFSDLKAGDFCYSINDDGKRVYAVMERVVRVWPGPNAPVRGGLFKTLPCYSNGEPMLFFGMWFRRTSGIEYGNHNFERPTDRRRVRLYLDLPVGIHVVSQPRRKAEAA